MKLKDQVTSLELSKKLKELGIKQESLFYYIDNKIYINHQTHYPDPENIKDHISAFTASELLEFIPFIINLENGESYLQITNNYAHLKNEKNIYIKTLGVHLIGKKYEIKYKNSWINVKSSNNLSNSLSNMLIYLIENKLMEIK